MKEAKQIVFCGLLLLIGGYSALAQVPPQMTCNTIAAVPPLVRAEGKAELVSDIVLVCTGGNPATPGIVNMSVFLNTNVTSNLTGPGLDETEAMVLIDEPQPTPALNMSNGFTFTGQVKGTSGVIASGNVFTGIKTGSTNQLVFLGVPVVPPGAGTRRFRFTNIRALPIVASTAPAPIMAFISIAGPISIAISSPVQTVGWAAKGLAFTATPAGTGLDLKFKELFTSAFKKRIENGVGPLAPVKQDVPGTLHCTESEFNPDFGTVAPGAPGSANTGTRFVAKITGIPGSVMFVQVPNDVLSSSGQLVAARIAPFYAPPFASGVPIVTGGTGFVPVSGGSVTLLYEVVASAPYAGVNGCNVLDSFTITATPWFFGSLANANATGFFAPVDPTPVISGPAPEPRFN